MSDYNIIGKRMPRIDTRAKVMGKVRYSADIKLHGMLVGKIKRCPYAHARILNIDTSKALALPGVKAVVKGKDTEGVKWGVFGYTRDQQFIQTDKARYIGDEVAGVAAVDEDTALKALDLIEVEYEQLPAVFDPMDAMVSETELIHEDFPNNINIFEKAHYIREDTFTAPEESYFQAEPYAVVARFDEDECLEVWCPNGGPHMKSKPLSNSFKLPLHKVKIKKIAIGGAFGGRSEICPADYICALLAKKTSAPVKIVFTREENTIATRQGHAMITTHKTGVDKEGRVLARETTCYMDGGAYSSTGPIATTVPFLSMEQAYRMESVRYNGYRIYTNKPIRGMIRIHGRGFACGLDTQLDMIAEHLGIDPVEIRLRNSRQPGEYTNTKSLVSSCAMDETIHKAVEKSGFKEKWGKLPPYHGIGIGTNSVQTGFPMGIRGGSQSFIKFNEDGEATVMTGVVDNGQGNDNMVVQIAAQELGLLPEDIHLVSADTETTSSDPGSYSQVSTFVGGQAVKNAASNCKKKLFAVAAKVLKVEPDTLKAENRLIFVKDDPEKSISIKKVVRISLLKFNSVNAEGGYWPKVDMRREWVSNPYGQMCEAFSFGTTIVEVKVDPDTGKVEVIEATAAQDVGYALNPLVIEGQFEGSIAMGGQGGMLTEYHEWHEGRCVNPTMLDYKLPLACDMPKINNIIVESIEPKGPYGAKEAAMSIAMSAAQGYSAAVNNAIGVHMDSFPLTPDKILAAIKNKKK